MTRALGAAPRLAVRGGVPLLGERVVAEEAAVALTYGGATHAVLMASPSDLEDLALGFSLTEGIVADPRELLEIVVAEHPGLGWNVRMHLAEGCADRQAARRRHMAGPVGCGLCGIESLEEALRPPPAVRGSARLSAAEIGAAMAALPAMQAMNRAARALHAAAFYRPGAGILAVREDVGRHNALDKLAGALARGRVRGGTGAVLLTSRVSVEMVQKTARIGAPLLVAVSAPTALAIRAAEAAGITLVACAREDGFEVFTHPSRVFPAPRAARARPQAGAALAG